MTSPDPIATDPLLSEIREIARTFGGELTFDPQDNTVQLIANARRYVKRQPVYLSDALAVAYARHTTQEGTL